MPAVPAVSRVPAMTAAVVTISKGVADAINAGSYSQAFAAQHGYLTKERLDNLDTLTVIVTPRDPELARYTEQSWDERYSVQIVVAKKVTAGEDSEIDDMLTLADEIYREVRSYQSSGTHKWRVREVQWQPLYDGPRLRQHGLFLSAIEVVADYQR